MAQCEVCGNDYYLAFEVVTAGRHHVFDSFECAIQRLAPVCHHCGCKILGHGIEAKGTFFCFVNCARRAQAKRLFRLGMLRLVVGLNRPNGALRFHCDDRGGKGLSL